MDQSPTVSTEDLGRYRWVAMGVVLVGTFMVILDTTIVNVALPQIGIDLGAPTGIEWVVTGYLLAVGILQPATGWLADRFGRKLVFTVSLALFATGSLLSALAPNLPALVGFRVLQGLGGGSMMPVGLTMIYELFPPDQRGTALGIWGVAAMAAPALGPVIGGYLVTSFSWRWLFMVNVPIGLVGVIGAIRLLRDFGFREHRPFDGLGLAMAGSAMALLLYAFSQALTWGLSSTRTVSVVGVGLLLVAVFAWRELHIDHPLIDVRMFGIGTFSITIGIVWLLTLGQFARLVFIPLELESLRGMTALQVGLLLGPAALGSAATMPLGGRLADKIGSRIPVMVGVGLMGVALWFLGHLGGVESNLHLILILGLQGMGIGLAMMPNTVAAMNSVSSRLVAQASAVRSLNRQVSGSLSVAILSSLVVARMGSLSVISGTDPIAAQSAYNSVFLVGLAGAAVALVMAAFLPGRVRSRTIQEERAAEHREIVAGAFD